MSPLALISTFLCHDPIYAGLAEFLEEQGERSFEYVVGVRFETYRRTRTLNNGRNMDLEHKVQLSEADGISLHRLLVIDRENDYVCRPMDYEEGEDERTRRFTDEEERTKAVHGIFLRHWGFEIEPEQSDHHCITSSDKSDITDERL